MATPSQSLLQGKPWVKSEHTDIRKLFEKIRAQNQPVTEKSKPITKPKKAKE
jgi:hypothetical protein